MSDNEFGSLNYKEYESLLDRKRKNDQREQLMAGIVAASIYNAAPSDGKREAMSPLEFVPELKKMVEDSKDMRKMTPEQQRDHMLGVFGKRVFSYKK